MEAQEVITKKKPRIPFWMYKFISSYMSTYYLNVYPETSLKKVDEYNLVFISHGMAGNEHSHSSLAQWWASRGYIVITLQHDESGRIRTVENKDEEAFWKENYEHRNQTLKSRSN